MPRSPRSPVRPTLPEPPVPDLDPGRLARVALAIPGGEQLLEARLRRDVPRRVAEALRDVLGEHVELDLDRTRLVRDLAAGVVVDVTLRARDVPIAETGAHLAELRLDLHRVQLPEGKMSTWGEQAWTAERGRFVARIAPDQLHVAARGYDGQRSEWLALVMPFVRGMSLRGDRLRLHLQVGYLDTVLRVGEREIVVDLAANPGIPRLPAVLRGGLPLPPWHLSTEGLPVGARVQGLQVEDDLLVARGPIDGSRLFVPEAAAGADADAGDDADDPAA